MCNVFMIRICVMNLCNDYKKKLLKCFTETFKCGVCRNTGGNVILVMFLQSPILCLFLKRVYVYSIYSYYTRSHKII